MKRIKISEYPNIEVSLLNWFIQCRDLKNPINESILKEKFEFLLLNLVTNNLKLVKNFS